MEQREVSYLVIEGPRLAVMAILGEADALHYRLRGPCVFGLLPEIPMEALRIPREGGAKSVEGAVVTIERSKWQQARRKERKG